MLVEMGSARARTACARAMVSGKNHAAHAEPPAPQAHSWYPEAAMKMVARNCRTAQVAERLPRECSKSTMHRPMRATKNSAEMHATLLPAEWRFDRARSVELCSTSQYSTAPSGQPSGPCTASRILVTAETPGSTICGKGKGAIRATMIALMRTPTLLPRGFPLHCHS